MIRIFLYILLLSITSFAQDKEYIDPQGRDFWLCFMRNHLDPPSMTNDKLLHLELFIAAETTTLVRIDIDSLSVHKELTVNAGDVVNIPLSSLCQITSSEVIEKGLSVHVTSDDPVTVYGLNRRKKTTDTFLAYPVEALGKNYRTANYSIAVDLLSEFAIIATEDGTEVTIIPTVETTYDNPRLTSNQNSQFQVSATGHQAGEAFTVKLNKGDTYQVLAKKVLLSANKCDLTGTLITSNKKIAVFSGHQCAYVPDELLHCNHLVEQIPPISSWGRHYYVGRQQKRAASTIRVIANEPGTKVFVNSKLEATLNAGEFYEKPIIDEVQVTSNKQIMVVQYSHGSMRDSIGDPMMMMISPVQQYLKSYSFATPVNGYWEHFVNVICPSDAINDMRLDGAMIPKEKWSKFQNTRYSIAYLKVDFGKHEITCSEPFGMSAYGFGYAEDQFDAYGNSGGQSFLKVSSSDTLAPTMELFAGKSSEIIIRDDRRDDSGLNNIKILKKVNMKYGAPLLEKSAPQISLYPEPEDPKLNAEITIEATDMKNNSSVYTLCYRYDNSSGQMIYDLNEGDDSCVEIIGLNIGLDLSIGNSLMFVGKGGVSEFDQDGKLNDASTSWNNIAVSAFYDLNDKVGLGLSLTYLNRSFQLNGADSVIKNTRDPISGELRPYQEAGILVSDVSSISLQTFTTYDIYKSFYAKAGLQFHINTSTELSYYKEILTPEYFVFENGTKRSLDYQGDISDMSSFNTDLGLGLGYKSSINFRWNYFIEYNYYLGLTNFIGDDFVRLNRSFITSGIRYRF